MGILKGIIKSKDMKIKHVAKQLDVTETTITNWDEKKTHPSVTQFNLLSKILGMPFDRLHTEIYLKELK